MNDALHCPHCQADVPLITLPASEVPRCPQCASPLPWLHAGTDASFNDDIQASVPVLVDFWAPWCGPCRFMEPVLEELAEELAGQVRVVKINVDEHPVVATSLEIHSIPTLLMYHHGELVDEVVGAVPKFMLVDRVKHLLNL